MISGSQTSVEETLVYNEKGNLEQEIKIGMEKLLVQFNRRVLDVIEGIDPKARRKGNFFTTLRKSFHKIIGRPELSNTENITETVKRNCLLLIHLSEIHDISILPIFGNLILNGVNDNCGVRIGTISIRGKTETWGIKGGFYMDSLEAIYDETRRYFQKDTTQNI